MDRKPPKMTKNRSEIDQIDRKLTGKRVKTHVLAFVACTHVWFYSPLKRSHKIKMGCIAEFWSVILKVVFNPFFESIGKCFGSISITKKVERV